MDVWTFGCLEMMEGWFLDWPKHGFGDEERLRLWFLGGYGVLGTFGRLAALSVGIGVGVCIGIGTKSRDDKSER